MAVFVGIACGYLAAIAVHVLLGLVITREGRRVLTDGTGMSRAYYTQLGLSWMVAGVAAALVVLRVVDDKALAPIALVAVVTLLSFAMIRARNKVPHQQTVADTLMLMLCACIGFAVPAYMQLA